MVFVIDGAHTQLDLFLEASTTKEVLISSFPASANKVERPISVHPREKNTFHQGAINALNASLPPVKCLW